MNKKLFVLLMVLPIMLVFAFPTPAIAAPTTVSDETALRAAINGASGPLSIELTSDIPLTLTTLTVPVGKEITLLGNLSLWV